MDKTRKEREKMKPASTVDMNAPDHKLVRQLRGQTLAADPSVSQREAAIDNCRKDSELANSDMVFTSVRALASICDLRLH
ncbi:hypothetical protein MJO28_001259 [Puccinia striiformis f. sp. tritici]|uniref:Uncharacterized protein n=1 Tax=Puccinia striiformis f. sp. tritici TaxID=168172 RepID=A0ACC0ETF8_9BASI|nr:hypothetical protein MJO28_001259 [Puccinia striiformis f. sp. tritici]